jgi:hypothetical protein
MDEIISYKMCAVKVRNAKLRNYLKVVSYKKVKFQSALLATITYSISLERLQKTMRRTFKRVIWFSKPIPSY